MRSTRYNCSFTKRLSFACLLLNVALLKRFSGHLSVCDLHESTGFESCVPGINGHEVSFKIPYQVQQRSKFFSRAEFLIYENIENRTDRMFI